MYCAENEGGIPGEWVSETVIGPLYKQNLVKVGRAMKFRENVRLDITYCKEICGKTKPNQPHLKISRGNL